MSSFRWWCIIWLLTAVPLGTPVRSDSNEVRVPGCSTQNIPYCGVMTCYDTNTNKVLWKRVVCPADKTDGDIPELYRTPFNESRRQSNTLWFKHGSSAGFSRSQYDLVTTAAINVLLLFMGSQWSEEKSMKEVIDSVRNQITNATERLRKSYDTAANGADRTSGDTDLAKRVANDRESIAAVVLATRTVVGDRPQPAPTPGATALQRLVGSALRSEEIKAKWSLQPFSRRISPLAESLLPFADTLRVQETGAEGSLTAEMDYEAAKALEDLSGDRFAAAKSQHSSTMAAADAWAREPGDLAAEVARGLLQEAKSIRFQAQGSLRAVSVAVLGSNGALAFKSVGRTSVEPTSITRQTLAFEVASRRFDSKLGEVRNRPDAPLPGGPSRHAVASLAEDVQALARRDFFSGDFEQARLKNELAVGLLDFCLGLTGAGWISDAYQAVTGKHWLTGRELSTTERVMSIVGVASAGISTQILKTAAVFGTISKVARRIGADPKSLRGAASRARLLLTKYFGKNAKAFEKEVPEAFGKSLNVGGEFVATRDKNAAQNLADHFAKHKDDLVQFGGKSFRDEAEYLAAAQSFARSGDVEAAAFQRVLQHGPRGYVKYNDATREFLVIDKQGRIGTYFGLDLAKVKKQNPRNPVLREIEDPWEYVLYKARH